VVSSCLFAGKLLSFSVRIQPSVKIGTVNLNMGLSSGEDQAVKGVIGCSTEKRSTDRSQRMELSVAIPFEIDDKAAELKLSTSSHDNASNSVASQFVSLQSNHQRASDTKAPRKTQQFLLESEVSYFWISVMIVILW
jgi:hypothetical protein